MSKKEIENDLCDIVDALFSDGIETTTELDVNKANARAAFIDRNDTSLDDQSGITRRKAKIQVIRDSRSKALDDSDKLESCFPTYSKKFDSSLALSISRNYITSPIKMVVGSQTAYSISVDLTITSI